jgi:large subunit ribosomal protein L21
MSIYTEDSIKNFTIVQASGRQYLFQPGKWYDLNKIKGDKDDIVKLQRVLLHKNNKKVVVGKPCIEGSYVLGIIIQHFKGKKTCVFKYKPKKKYSRKIGFRPLLTRVLIYRTFEIK